MQILSTLLLGAALVAAHGYVDNATIGGQVYQFYQPYTDPYTNPTPKRVSRRVEGNGPVTDLTYEDLQCGGYTDGGIVGSSPPHSTQLPPPVPLLPFVGPCGPTAMSDPPCK
ncbi:hypothetical protein NUW58_g10397 [Xylaria curta]|uniref:Uncharacterized protein n=1 Tax=Xylaria curta TaxID=42375 RepID=A0ACC1MN78_9PEZI|nr:hypothetical protein NUW58_g10397 [Xylaria curta]